MCVRRNRHHPAVERFPQWAERASAWYYVNGRKEMKNRGVGELSVLRSLSTRTGLPSRHFDLRLRTGIIVLVLRVGVLLVISLLVPVRRRAGQLSSFSFTGICMMYNYRLQ